MFFTLLLLANHVGLDPDFPFCYLRPEKICEIDPKNDWQLKTGEFSLLSF